MSSSYTKLISAMHPSEHKKLTHYSPLLVMSVLGLMVGLFISIIGAQQSTDTRSKAAIVPGNYNGTLTSSGNIIQGSVTGDVIGSSNTIGGNVAGCVKGNYNIIGGSVSGTVTGTGNIITLGSGTGPCLSSQPTPTRIPTSAPTVGPTATIPPTPTPTLGVTPGLTLVPTAIKTPTPQPTAILTLVPTAALTSVPTQTQPTATIAPGNTSVVVTLLLHGIGKGGDSVNPNSVGTTNPQRPLRIVTLDVYNAQNQLVANKQGSVTFDTADGNFVGTVDLGPGIVTGAHTIRIKDDQYLRGIVSGIQNLTAGGSKTLASLTLVGGDVNNDNQINIIDYNIIVGCYSDLLPPVSCNAGDEVRADIDDDGNVNQFDYNFFIRELTNLGGQ